MLRGYICFSRESVNDKKNKIDAELGIIVDISGYYNYLRLYTTSLFSVFLWVGSQWSGIVNNSIFGIHLTCGVRSWRCGTIGTV